MGQRHTRSIATIAVRAIGRLSAASFVTRTLVLGLLTMFISGAAHAVVQPARDEPGATTDLVESMVAGVAQVNQVPTDFVGDMGYTPATASGTLLHPFGGCSSPGEVGPDRFSEACQIHDLGYDVLRYAEIEGERFSAKTRFKIDWAFYGDMLKTCETATCSLTATAYFSVVSANSVRQGYKTPHAEPTTPWMALAVAIFGLGAAGGLPAVKAKIDSDASGVRGASRRWRSPLGVKRKKCDPTQREPGSGPTTHIAEPGRIGRIVSPDSWRWLTKPRLRLRLDHARRYQILSFR